MKPDIIKETKGYSKKIDGYLGVYCPCGKTLYVKNPSKAMSVDIECSCGFTITLYTSLKETIAKLADSIPLQTKANIDTKYKFETETNELINAFAKLDIALTDNNGEYRSTENVLNDLAQRSRTT